MAHNCINTQISLLGHFILCVGCSSVLSAVLLFLPNPAMPAVTLAAANRDTNKYG